MGLKNNFLRNEVVYELSRMTLEPETTLLNNLVGKFKKDYSGKVFDKNGFLVGEHSTVLKSRSIKYPSSGLRVYSTFHGICVDNIIQSANMVFTFPTSKAMAPVEIFEDARLFGVSFVQITCTTDRELLGRTFKGCLYQKWVNGEMIYYINVSPVN